MKTWPSRLLRKDHVLVRVKACALNHLDLFISERVAWHQAPHINGSDIAGEVVDKGEYINDIAPGQRVVLAPMNFCNVCEKCMAGETEFLPAVLRLRVCKRWRQLRTDRCAAG